MSAIKFLNLLILAIFLWACGAKFQPPPLAKFDEKIFEITSDEGSSTLYIAHANEAYNFTLISAFGAPLARRVLTPQGKFENIGFLPPNSAYNELFIRILEMIKSGKNETEILINKEKFKVKSIDIR